MDDKRDQWTPMIEASHPLEVGTKDAHDAYATAMEMVGNRHSKGALVDLVCWLVQRVDAAEQQLRTRGVALPAVPDGVWEALQRLIENAATLGPASKEDALLVARWRGQFVAARERNAGVSASDDQPKEPAP